jgi:rubrerythrin
MSTDIPPLALAFLHQTQAAAKNRIRSQKAAQEGNTEAALLFQALAEAQDVHSKKTLLFLRGRVQSTAGNLAESLQEARELAVELLEATILSQAEGDQAGSALLTQMAKSLASHLALPCTPCGETQHIYICAICGHIHVGGSADDKPGRCPVCQAVPDKFAEVAAA